MAFNSFIRRVATCSMIPMSRRSVCNVVGVQFLRFSSTATATASLIESFYNNKAITKNPAEYPFTSLSFYDPNMIVWRRVENETTIIVLHKDTYKVNNGNPSISINATIHLELTFLKLEFEATVEPEMICIQSIQMRDEEYEEYPLSAGHLSVFEEYLDTRGINARNLGVLFNCFRKN